MFCQINCGSSDKWNNGKLTSFMQFKNFLLFQGNTATDETECDIILNGTSAAASMVSGIIALALEAK